MAINLPRSVIRTHIVKIYRRIVGNISQQDIYKADADGEGIDRDERKEVANDILTRPANTIGNKIQWLSNYSAMIAFASFTLGMTLSMTPAKELGTLLISGLAFLVGSRVATVHIKSQARKHVENRIEAYQAGFDPDRRRTMAHFASHRLFSAIYALIASVIFFAIMVNSVMVINSSTSAFTFVADAFGVSSVEVYARVLFGTILVSVFLWAKALVTPTYTKNIHKQTSARRLFHNDNLSDNRTTHSEHPRQPSPSNKQVTHSGS